MFVSTEKVPYSELPRNCTFSESLWCVLAGFSGTRSRTRKDMCADDQEGHHLRHYLGL